jgi:hypothetical protein
MDQFVAYTDAGGLVMGYWDLSALPLSKLAQEYTLCHVLLCHRPSIALLLTNAMRTGLRRGPSRDNFLGRRRSADDLVGLEAVNVVPCGAGEGIATGPLICFGCRAYATGSIRA